MEPSMMLNLQEMSQTPSLWSIESPRENKTRALTSKRTCPVSEYEKKEIDVNNEKTGQFSSYDLSEVVVMQRVEIERLVREREKNSGVLKNLDERNNELENERNLNVELNKKLFELQATNKHQQILLSEKHEEITALNFKFQDASVQLQNNCMEMEKLQKQTSHLTEFLAQESAKTERISGEEALKKTLRELEKERLSNRGQSILIMELEGMAKEWALKYSKLEKELYEKQQRLQKLSGMERNLEDHQIEVEKLGMIAKAKIYEVTELNSQTQKLKTMYDQEGKKYELLVQQTNYEIENLSQEKDDLSKKLVNREKEITELYLNNNEMAKRVSRYELDEDETKRIMEHKDITINELSNRGEELSSKNKMLEEQIRIKEDQMEELRYQIQRVKLSAEQEKQLITDLQWRVDEKSEFVNKLHLDVISLHRNAMIEEEKAKEFDKMINMNQRLTESVGELQQNVYDLEHQILQCHEQLNSAHVENTELKDECEMLKKLSEIQNQELNCLKESRETCQQEILRLRKFETVFTPMKEKIKQLFFELKKSDQHSKNTQNKNEELLTICISLRGKIMEIQKNGYFPEWFKKLFSSIKTNFGDESLKIKNLLKKQEEIENFVDEIKKLVISVCEHIKIKNEEWMQVNGNLNDVSQNLKMLSSLQDENNRLKLRLLHFESSERINAVKLNDEEENEINSTNNESNWQPKYKIKGQVDSIKEFLEPVKDQFKIGSRFVLTSKSINNNSYQTHIKTQLEDICKFNDTFNPQTFNNAQNNKFQIRDHHDNIEQYKMGKEAYSQETKTIPVRAPFVFKTSQRKEI